MRKDANLQTRNVDILDQQQDRGMWTKNINQLTNI